MATRRGWSARRMKGWTVRTTGARGDFRVTIPEEQAREIECLDDGQDGGSVSLAVNAMLTAAPELYLALETALTLIGWMSGAKTFAPGGDAHIGWLKHQPKIAEIRLAIEKATRS